MTPSFFRLSAMAGLVLAVAGRPPHASAQESDIQRLSLDHYLDMESVSNPQISPDGSRVVYTRAQQIPFRTQLGHLRPTHNVVAGGL